MLRNSWLAACGLIAVGFTQLEAQVDNRDRAFLQLGGSFNTGSANPAGLGFLYWNKVDWPGSGMDTSVIWAGPFLDSKLAWPGLISEKTTFGVSLGAFGGVGGLPLEYVEGKPLRNEEINAASAYGGIFINHEFAKFTKYEIPLNLYVGYGVSYTDYAGSDDLRRDFAVPTDPVTQNVEVKLQLGGVKPAIRDVEALDVHIRYIYGHNSNWQQFGPIFSTPYQANQNYHVLIGAMGASLPVAEGHYLGGRVTAAKGWGLDRSTNFVLGGFLIRSEESTRIIWHYTGEYMADAYLLFNFDYQFPILEWQGLAGHLYADYAIYQRNNDRANDWQDALGIGVGLSVEMPYNSTGMVAYGYGVDAERRGGEGRHEFVVQVQVNLW